MRNGLPTFFLSKLTTPCRIWILNWFTDLYQLIVRLLENSKLYFLFIGNISWKLVYIHGPYGPYGPFRPLRPLELRFSTKYLSVKISNNLPIFSKTIKINRNIHLVINLKRYTGAVHPYSKKETSKKFQIFAVWIISVAVSAFPTLLSGFWIRFGNGQIENDFECGTNLLPR